MAKQNNKEKALSALLNTSTIVEASQLSGLSEETIYRYLKDDDFIKDYRQARRSLVENSISKIQSATSEAVETLRRNLTCETPSVEVRAAQIILDSAFKGVELVDINERLENLENEHQEQTK